MRNKEIEMTKKDLPALIVAVLAGLGGSGTREDVAWKVKEAVDRLVDPADPFIFKWYYNLGWAKNDLKNAGIVALRKGKDARKPEWYLV